MKVGKSGKLLPWAAVAITLVLSSFTFINMSGKRHLNLNTYTGEQLFRGIFLNEGEIAAAIPSLQEARLKWDNTPAAVQKEKAHMYDALIADIRQTQPAFFDAFKDKIASRDFNAIEEAVKEGSRMMYDASKRSAVFGSALKAIDEMVVSGEISNFDLNTPAGSEAFARYLEKKVNADRTTGNDAVNFPTKEARVVVALPVAVAVWAWKYLWQWSYAPGSAEGTALSKERLVVDIADL